jgi:Zn-finger protein
MPKEQKRKTLCPECDTEVEITRDEDGADVGVCDNCGLNVGQVLTKDRYDNALAKLRARSEEEKKKTKKKTGGGFFS